MKVELATEEARSLLVLLVDRVIEEAGLPETDRAAVRKWRSGMTPGSAGMRELSAKVNADIERTLENKKKSALVKADWR